MRDKALKLLRQTQFLDTSELPYKILERWQKKEIFKKVLASGCKLCFKINVISI